MNSNNETKLMVIENYIDQLTSDAVERIKMKQNAVLYVEEDHVDEIGNRLDEVLTPIKKVLQTLSTDAIMALNGDWDTTTQEGIESFNDQLELIDTLGLIEIDFENSDLLD